MKIGVQELCNQLKKLDSGFRRNDKKWCFSTFYMGIKVDIAAKRHKTHKNNNFHIGISNSCGRQKYKFGLLIDHQLLEAQLASQD